MTKVAKWMPAVSMATAALLVSALSGCGTRVHLANGVGVGTSGAGSSGLGGVGATAAGSGMTPGSAGLGSSSGVGGSGSAATAGTGSSGAGSTGGALGVTGGAGGSSVAGSAGASKQSRVRGVTATTIQIGYMYSDTATFKAFSAACSACSSFGDQTFYPQLFNVLGTDLNSRGGILGHKVVFDGYAYDSTEAATDSSQLSSISQAACQHFTADSPVFAAISDLGSVLSPCLTKGGVSTIAPVGGIGDTVDNSPMNSSLLYEPSVSDSNDFMPVYVQRMAAQGYFSGWDTTTGAAGPQPLKIGMISFSDPEYAHTDDLLQQALTADGYKIYDHIRYSAELDTQSQSVQNAIVKFRSEGITHVMGTGANGLFMYEAVGQNYYPRYAYMTASVSDTDNDSQKGMAGSMGEGIFPVLDIDPGQNPPSVGPLQTRCEQLATKAGVGWQSSYSFHADVLQVCDAVWDLADALDKSSTLTPGGLAAGFDELGPIASPATFAETWSTTRHASAATMEDFQFHTSCSCFRYTGTKTAF